MLVFYQSKCAIEFVDYFMFQKYQMFFKNIIYYIYGQILPKNCLFLNLKKKIITAVLIHAWFSMQFTSTGFFLIFLFSWYFESISKHCHKNQRIDWMEAREKWIKKRRIAHDFVEKTRQENFEL